MNYRFLQRTVVLFVMLACCCSMFADGNTVVIMRKNTGYAEDQWTYSGEGKELQTSSINEMWNAGKRITSVYHDKNGWFVAGAKNTGYTMQTYHYNTDFPTKWLEEHYNDSYMITSIAYGNSKWFIMMSQNTKYTSQVYFWVYENNATEKVKKYWDAGFEITNVCYFSGRWLFVMSENSPYSQQSFSFNNTLDSSKSYVKQKWDAGMNITQWVSNGTDNKFLAVMSKFSNGTSPGERYSWGSSPSSQISNNWKEGYAIVSVGGGNTAAAGMTKCYTCKGSGVFLCRGCNGTGRVPYVGLCGICGGTGRSKCSYCYGTGEQKGYVSSAATPNERYIDFSKSRTSNFSRGGVPNYTLYCNEYVTNGNYRKNSQGKSGYWSGECSVVFDIANCKITAKVNGKTYVFRIYAMSSGTNVMTSAQFFTSSADNHDEKVFVCYVGDSTDKDNYRCFIKSKSQGIDIVLHGIRNYSEASRFIDKCIQYNKTH